MGLSNALARRATRTAHVLVVEVAGHAWTRMALERACAARGWRLASSPADADVLAVCGVPGPELSQVVSMLWEQLPGPRARIDASAPQDVPAALDAGTEQLMDADRQRTDAAHRSMSLHLEGRGGMDHEGMRHAGMDDSGTDHQGMGNAGMGHGGMDMAPGGIPLAEGGEDRDGLEMDVLKVALGPVLPCWPAGLVLECALQGDVIIDASARLVDVATSRGAQEHREVEPEPDGPSGLQDHDLAAAALACDEAARVLALVGWPDRTARLLRLRNALLDAAASPQPADDERRGRLATQVQRERGAMARSALLRWSLRRLGVVDAARVEEQGLPRNLCGDARDRLLALLDRAAARLRSGAEAATEVPIRAAAIGDLVSGLDLATARLVIASLGIEAGIRAWEAVRA